MGCLVTAAVVAGCGQGAAPSGSRQVQTADSSAGAPGSAASAPVTSDRPEPTAEPSPDDSSPALPTQPPNADYYDALIGPGVLKMNESGCIVLETTGGRLTTLVWPHGYRLSANRQAILGWDPETVIRIGDRISLGGGIPNKAVFRLLSIPEECRQARDHTWLVAAVEL